jgi:protein-tyrosine-phosphatase
MRILFICKHNLFRSKVAESYFNKINKNPNIKAESAGAIKGDFLTKEQRQVLNLQIKTAKKYGLDIKGKPRGLSTSLLNKQDLVIVVANDLKKSLFNNKRYIKKLIIWNIKDVGYLKEKNMRKTINKIIRKIDKLKHSLEI